MAYGWEEVVRHWECGGEFGVEKSFINNHITTQNNIKH